MWVFTKTLLLSVFVCCLAATGGATAQPNLILTKEGVESIRAQQKLPPLLQSAFNEAEQRLARSLAEGVIVPMPKDPGGGYTHERHKENYKIINDAGTLYRLTGQHKYLEHAEAYLRAYADIYPDLPLHPQRKNQAPGRLFWQGLNESVWLVYVAQGYDAIRDDLSADSQAYIEGRLLRQIAEFLSTESPQTFQRIHNHGTWAAAGVGMAGYALGDQALVERALFGLDGDGAAGFLKQLDSLFSPDGYYTEGPYYQRYALMPFVLFGQAIANNEPDREIFKHRDGILLKAIFATIEQSYGGKFFPINDAIKEKGLDTPELVYAVAAAYELTKNAGLLSIAKEQGTTVLSGPGLQVALDVAAERAADFAFKTQLLSDGPQGDEGGLAILRMGEGPHPQTVVAKHTGQGMGHGHFDKLSLILYDGGREVLTDYGAARFLNVPSKEGGRYLPENETWAKQSIAHNTIVVGRQSHFGGDWTQGQKSWPTVEVFEQGDGLNVVAASIDDAYTDVKLRRTTFQLRRSGDKAPLILDVADFQGRTTTSLDLPYYFAGQLIDSSLSIKRTGASLEPLGQSNGYQHLWVEGVAEAPSRKANFTWLSGDRFYTYHSHSNEPAAYQIVRTGANDPDFNLRSEQGIMLSIAETRSSRLISVFEPHGFYDPAQEVTRQSASELDNVVSVRSETAALFVIKALDGGAILIGLADDTTSDVLHRVEYDGQAYEWRGPYARFDS